MVTTVQVNDSTQVKAGLPGLPLLLHERLAQVSYGLAGVLLAKSPVDAAADFGSHDLDFHLSAV